MKLALDKTIFGNIGIIHIIGIGGIGMSGIAEILHNLGYHVRGSDMAHNYVIDKLRAQNIHVDIGHKEENVMGASIVVKSSAVKDDNPEIISAKKNHIIVIKRSEMLAELMRLKLSIAVAGTHGKTTTTSLVAALFEKADLNPTVINGGIINNRGTNAYLGSGDFLIAEADESDATFIKIPSTIGVITNIDPEHLDFYGSFEKLKEAFRIFVENLPFYGFAVLCKDHDEVRVLSNEITDRKIITYGIESEDVNIRAINIINNADSSDFDVQIIETITNNKRYIRKIHLPIAGMHNVLNSLAAIAIAVQLNIKDDIIINGFSEFKGVKRRFTKVGTINDVTIVDDYAHHPKEIIATIKTAMNLVKLNGGRIIAVVQPHRYTRVNDLFSEFTHCFAGVDMLIMADIYSAGETPIVGISKEILVAAIKRLGYCDNVNSLDKPDDLAKVIKKIAQAKDVVLCMGAGSITSWAYNLVNELSI